ncbi:VOC family protein [Leptospira levettii]|uniref:VOC family protein n=1 Tax=Leptospira levettii TaxID=2023178 RepID=UPI000C2B2283|nr:VOC family protein [Leptospira levettii]MCG6146923.1 VOC family protein [Leptospira levettii]PKA27123.1 glyoxalase [Leptospira sp. mixed culture ATI2-C-A1]TGL13849.1 VOC family protein [Leptospira levettii]TGM75733.1 VOC family protein [Leptospira levettii]
MFPRINLITLGVSDLNRAVHFYETGLGWKKSKESNENVAFFQIGALVLGLFGEKDLAKDIGIPFQNRQEYSGLTLAQNVETEAEVDRIINEVRKLGATILKEPQKVFWGGYSAYFKDLDGHIFEVAYNPFFPLNEKGEIELKQ